MKFKSLDGLLKFIIAESIDLENTEIVFSNVEKLEEKLEVVAPIKEESFKAKIVSFFDSPQVDAIFEEENIMFVDHLEGNKDICGAGRVKVLGREIMTNLCESDGTAYVRLSIDINDKIMDNVLFKLQPSNADTKNTIHIRKDQLQ